MNFLQQNCRFGFYTQGRVSLCKSFKCGDKDLDDFFTEDAFLQSEHPIGFFAGVGSNDLIDWTIYAGKQFEF